MERLLLAGAGILLLGGLAMAVEDDADERPVRLRPPTSGRGSFSERAEIAACARRGLTHRGGPGRADGGNYLEVKAWERPFDRYSMRKEAEKGRREIVSLSGFTPGARDLADVFGIRLRRT